MKPRFWMPLIVLVLTLSTLALAGNKPLVILAQNGSEDQGTVKTLEIKVDQARDIYWEASIGMEKTWYVDDTPAFLIGTKPGQGDIVTFKLARGYEQRKGTFHATPGTYYVTARAGHGVKNAPGDIREFQVFGDVRGWITLN